MRLGKMVPVLLIVAMAMSLISCALITGPDKDVILKITARRIGFHGFQIKQDLFENLGQVAKGACMEIADQGEGLENAFIVIIERITKDTDDPLLVQDITDVIEILGIKFDAAFTLVGITAEKMKYLQIFVCAFAQGVEAAAAAKK